MPLQTALVVAGVLAPFVVEFTRWLQKKFVGSFLTGWWGYVVAGATSFLVTWGALVYTNTPFVLADFWLQGGFAFAIATTVFKLLLKPLNESTNLVLRTRDE